MAIVPFSPLPENRASQASPAFDGTAVPDMATGRGLIALGRGAGVLGDEMAALAQKIEDEDNETAAKEADNRMSLAFGKILYGDPEDAAAGPGYFNTKRQDAVQGYTPTEQALKEIVAGEVKMAGQNAVLRRLVEDAGGRRFSHAANRMLEYAGRERQANMVEVSEGRQGAALLAALRDPFDPVTLETSLETVAAEALDQADIGGVTDQNQIEEKVREAQSAVLTGVFNAYLAQEDISGAKTLFEKHKDKLSPELYQNARKSFLEEAGRVSAQALGREAFELFGMNKTEAMKWIDSVTDGRAQSNAWQQYQVWAGAQAADENRVRMLRNDALTQANYLRQMENIEQASLLKENNRIVYDHIHGGGDNSMRAFRQANPNVWQFFSDRGEINALEKYAQNYSTNNLYAPSSDGKTFFEILQMDPREQAGIDLRPYQQMLTEEEYLKINTVVANTRKTLGLRSANPGKLSEAEKMQQTFLNNLYTEIDNPDVVDFSSYGDGDEAKKRIARQRAWVIAEVTSMIQNNELKNREEIRDVLKRLTMPYNREVPKWFWTSEESIIGSPKITDKIDLNLLNQPQKFELRRSIVAAFGALPLGGEDFDEFIESRDGSEFIHALDFYNKSVISASTEDKKSPEFKNMKKEFYFKAAQVGLAVSETQRLFNAWRNEQGLSGFPLSAEQKATAYTYFLMDTETGYQDLGEFMAELKEEFAASEQPENE